nr:hypothetical protein [Tanacetum cinerariifolium]
MNHQYPTVAKIHVLDTGKFKQWQFRIQQYLQHEHYALWEVIEFGDSYKVPTNTDPNDTTRRRDDEQSGRTVTITTEDMQRKKNDVKARTTYFYLFLMSIKGSETLEQTFNRLQVIVSQLQFMDVEVEKDDLNQKFLTSLAPEWMMHTINIAFISSSKNSSGNEDGNIACVSTASTTFPTGSVNVTTFSQDTASAYIASQSNGSQIKFEDINQIDEDDMEEMDIKWSMTLLSMRADKFWKRTEKKISIQGSDVVGFDKSKVECFNCHKMGHFARECRAPRRWDWSYMANEGEDHALVADGETRTEFALMANTENKRSDQVKEGVGYNDVPPAAADLYLSLKKYLSWNGLPEFMDDTVTDYSRHSFTVASTSAEGQIKDSSTSEDVGSPNPPKPFVKFVKPKDSQSESKTKKQETPKKPQVKYAGQYRHSNKKPKGNQRNWNTLKSYQLGSEFVLHKKPCFNCGDFSHLSPSHKSVGHRSHRSSMRPSYRPVGHRPHGPAINPKRPTMNGARPYKSFFN